ncbi:hypothetical protein FPV67DRAFT_1511460 [Lyophyllum atratum]|nr:hypothetical protein FPV67DRAFT_1511460 [Lyophyllum atratum]
MTLTGRGLGRVGGGCLICLLCAGVPNNAFAWLEAFRRASSTRRSCTVSVHRQWKRGWCFVLQRYQAAVPMKSGGNFTGNGRQGVECGSW